MNSLSPRAYLLLDRASKLVAIVLIAASLSGAGGPFAPFLAILGGVIGIATIFIDVEE
jgi:hypothetical protein